MDGSQHLERALLDARRDNYLESLGFRVLRFWDNQVLNETDAIIEVIAQVLEKREEGPPSLRLRSGQALTFPRTRGKGPNSHSLILLFPYALTMKRPCLSPLLYS